MGGDDPSIYVLQGCDERGCGDGDGLDLCGTGADEHFTFIPTIAGSYVVAFDSVDSRGFAGRVEAYRTECGDGMPHHSENCDDGNDNNDDGCDNLCRTVLRPPMALEEGVNDDIYSANALRIGVSEPIGIRGGFDNFCEVDVFAVDVPSGHSISATILAETGEACSEELAGTRLALIESTGEGQPRMRVAGSVMDGEFCPTLNAEPLAQNLPAGTYYLQVVRESDRMEALRYRLQVEILPGT